ncbi:MAG: carbamoyltransferase HypF, partial [Planctomycetota bacterium]
LHGGGTRRSDYPFNTCAACGPRFSIAREVPFDRENSAMDDFPLCGECLEEFESPADRRFHAQTMSCPECGPELTLHDSDGQEMDRPLKTTRRMLSEGRIVAVKGLGGYHLACDAAADEPIRELRRRKGRPHKPLAIMVRDMESCRDLCRVGEAEEEVLLGEQAPIVLLESAPGAPLSEYIAPGLDRVGVMLPYTPLHAMLFEGAEMPPALVMTSCNRSEEPIALSEDEVLGELGDVVDAVLTNNRDIENRCDDSVVAVRAGSVVPMRRSRGYVPRPILLDREGPTVLATGGMLKNTFALTTGRRVFLSQHMGNVSDADSAEHFTETCERFSRLLKLEPEAVVSDMHPDYPTTRFAQRLADEKDIPHLEVQHHHAHIASCLAENGHRGRVIGVAMDGTGYGEDGTIWGGEFLVADRAGYERACHLGRARMPGGEQAVHNPDRMAASYLYRFLGEEEAVERMPPLMGERDCRLALQVADREAFSPLTSSCGRLFDAVAALLGVRGSVTYRGQAAMELEALCAEGESGEYAVEFGAEEIGLAPLFRGICRDLDDGVEDAIIAARFHNTLSGLIVEGCRRLRDSRGIETVALSGGVMQNGRLLETVIPALRGEGFRVLTHGRVPPGDGGLCLGQAACAIERLSNGEEDA